MNRAKRSLLLTALTAALLAVQLAHARSIVTPESQLDRYGLPKDPATLAQYLSDGIPADHQPPDTGGYQPVFLFERWRLYAPIVGYLGDTKAPEAIPVLTDIMLNGPGPAVLHDLDIYMLGGQGRETSELLDLARVQELWVLRATCATALSRINGKPALPDLKKFLDGLSAQVDVVLDQGDPNSQLLSAFSRTCRAVTALDDKEGIDRLVATLDRLPKRAPETIIYFLRICTGQSFGPDYADPPHMRPQEIQKWQDWWATERASFVIDRETVATLTAPVLPTKTPETLREHVVEAEKRHFDYDGTSMAKQSVAWLEKNGPRRAEGLLKIVEDQDENAKIRKEALERYAQYAGKDARKVLEKLATDESRYTLEVERLHIQSTAFRQLTKKFPDQAERTAKKCLLMDSNIAQHAFGFLNKNPENRDYLVRKFSDMSESGQFHAIQYILQFDPALPKGVITEALTGDVRFNAERAAIRIQGTDLEKTLSAESREHLERWMQDPSFYLAVLGNNPVRGTAILPKVQKALDMLEGTDTNAASAYSRVYRMLQSRMQHDELLQRDPSQANALIERARTGFLACVDAYSEEKN